MKRKCKNNEALDQITNFHKRKKEEKKKEMISPQKPWYTLPHSICYINITTAMKFAPVYLKEMNWQWPLWDEMNWRGSNTSDI